MLVGVLPIPLLTCINLLHQIPVLLDAGRCVGFAPVRYPTPADNTAEMNRGAYAPRYRIPHQYQLAGGGWTVAKELNLRSLSRAAWCAHEYHVTLRKHEWISSSCLIKRGERFK